MITNKKPRSCPYCDNSVIYVSDGTYGSGYENKGYKVSCICGYAWTKVPWQKTEEAAIEEWNKVVEQTPMTNREWLHTLTTEEFVTWLVCDEEYDRKAMKPKQPTPRLSTIKHANISATAALKEWLNEERKENGK